MSGVETGMYEALFDALPDPALALDADGRILAANPAFEARFGPQPAGRAFTSLCLDPLDGHVALAALKGGRAAEPGALVLRGIEGGEIAVRIISAASNAGRRTLLMRPDETQAAPGARPSRDGAYALDLDGGRCLVSGVFAGGLDLSAPDGAVDGAAFLGLIHPDDRPQVDEAIADAGPEPFATVRFSCRMRGRMGEWIEMRHRVQIAARRADGSPRRLAGVARGVVGGRDAEDADARAVADAVIAGRYGAWTLDFDTNQLTFSAAALDILGLEDQRTLTLDGWRARLHPDDMHQCVDGVAAMAAGGVMECCYRLERADGRIVWVEDRGRLVERHPDGRPRIARGLISDASARKLLEEELRNYAAELERSNRELERFTRVAAHDLQEPVRKIAAFSMLLERTLGASLSAEAGQALGFISDAARRMRALIDDLSSYARASSRPLQSAPTDLNAVLVRALERNAAEIAAAGASIEAAELPEVLGDAELLEDLLANLISNAVKYRADAPPRVEIEASPPEPDRPDWRVTVRDRGIGLESRLAEKIFQPFGRLHPREAYPGTGIGLAICQQAVERHGGRIWVESEPGAGAAFHFTLPHARRRRAEDGQEAA